MRYKIATVAATITILFALQAAQAQESRRINPYLYFTSAGFEGKALSVPAVTPDVPKADTPAYEPLSIPIGNFGVVLSQEAGARTSIRDGVVYRGGSLDNEASYAFLRELGVSAVVNLQSFHRGDPALCAKYGLTCRESGILPFDFISLTRSRAFQEAFRFVINERKAGHKVYIHCMKGKDRTGALAAALTIRERACGGDFDKVKLQDTVETSLKEHHFWLRNYPKWHAEITGWVDNFEGNKAWLCK
ncbi:MAG: tyrosine-protein phosphatase [Nitrospiraceae bacterium]|nr:tyrosine-protein phosphatase [Nitrospiraceae bacterium]